ncbi:MAG TPA: hypothetical protein VKH41_12960 [Myxococcota bacterium]|nr:hypothetical protein [Myxococcota bacterium]
MGSNGRHLRIWATALVAAGCAAPPLYAPTLFHLEVPVDPDHGERVELLVSLRSAPADRARSLPAGMEARIRVDDESDEQAFVDPGGIELIALDLTSFSRPVVSPADGLEVAPHQSGVVTARFAYPPGEGAGGEGLRAVDLRCAVALGGRQISNGITFHRVEAPPTISDPWFWEPVPRVVFRAEVDHRLHR